MSDVAKADAGDSGSPNPTEVLAGGKPAGKPSAHKRLVTPVPSLDALVGAHPESIRAIFRDGTSATPDELSDNPTGRILAFERFASVYLATRFVPRWLDGPLGLWQGKHFDHGGNAGANRFLGRTFGRFHAEGGTSVLDGEPALVLTYDKAGWPLSGMRDEIRMVGDRLAVGVALREQRGEFHAALWFGLEAAQ